MTVHVLLRASTTINILFDEIQIFPRSPLIDGILAGHDIPRSLPLRDHPRVFGVLRVDGHCALAGFSPGSRTLARDFAANFPPTNSTCSSLH
jgi:hypothetical protein